MDAYRPSAKQHGEKRATKPGTKEVLEEVQ
jgi:hypothetical protein